MGPRPRQHRGPRQKHQKRGRFAPSPRDTTPKTSAPRAAAGCGQHRELCAWLSFPMSQTGAPELGFWCKRPRNRMGCSVPSAPCLPPASLPHSRCPVPNRLELARTSSTPSPFHPSPRVPNLQRPAEFPSPAPPGLRGDGGGPGGDPGLADAPAAERDLLRGNEVSWCNFHCPL